MAKKPMSPLERKRLSLGLSQTDLAKKVGVSAATISFWENGRKRPAHDSWAPLAAALGMTVDEVMELIEPSQPVTTK